IGFDSCAVITGDITQIDLPGRSHSGLIEAEHILSDIRGIAVSHFSKSDVVRHPLVQKIIQAYEQGTDKTSVRAV
ncbi:MAG TPA: phosphate starvation-inducible protein PhoH, partial [Desulfobulbaceae bacterium]|nr:phosphate starvation-inducible protein PhoH [Desulfobulbaceae bacterium]